jgi:hypothetical protein
MDSAAALKQGGSPSKQLSVEGFQIGCLMIRTFAVILSLAIAAPANAGLRATYRTTEEAVPLIVEVADNGDARIGERDAEDYGLLVGGQFYMVAGKAGEQTVARVADIARAVDTVIGPVFGDAFTRAGPAAPKATIRTAAKGSRTVGGESGTIYAVSGLDHERPGMAIEVVASDATRLQPIGRALEGFMNAALIPGAPLLGAGAGELIEETRAIFALGTPLASDGRFTLEKVETVAVAAGRVALPDAPSTYETLVTKMRALMPNRP